MKVMTGFLMKAKKNCLIVLYENNIDHFGMIYCELCTFIKVKKMGRTILGGWFTPLMQGLWQIHQPMNFSW